MCCTKNIVQVMEITLQTLGKQYIQPKSEMAVSPVLHAPTGMFN